MSRKEALRDILKEKYGICNLSQLREAIKKQPKVDISLFCLRTDEENKEDADEQ